LKLRGGLGIPPGLMWKNLWATIFLFIFFILSAKSYAETVGVYRFVYSGPAGFEHLAVTAGDTFIGTLSNSLKRFKDSVKIIDKSVNPDKLNSKLLGKEKVDLLVAGRLNWLGEQGTLYVTWIRGSEEKGVQYLTLPKLDQLTALTEKFASQMMSPIFSIELDRIKMDRIGVNNKEVIVAHQEEKKPPKIVRVPENSKPTDEPPQVKQEKVASVSVLPPEEKPKKVTKQKLQVPSADAIRDYQFISQRLPFEVRSMEMADLNGDGKPEIILSADGLIQFYQRGDKGLAELATWRGSKYDRVIHVSAFRLAGYANPVLAVSNIWDNRAKSFLLSLEGNAPKVLVDDIPYLIRPIIYEGSQILAAETYASDEKVRHQLYELKIEGSKATPGRKLNFPYEVGLFGFEWYEMGNGGEKELLYLTPAGYLKLFYREGNHYKRRATSAEKLGGSFNEIETKLTNALNEVVSSRFTVSLGLQVLPAAQPGEADEVLLANNGAYLRSSIGQGFLLKSAKLVKLKWTELGFSETWETRKIEGGFAGYIPIKTKQGWEILTAARLRDKGFMSPTLRNESVVLTYPM